MNKFFLTTLIFSFLTCISLFPQSTSRATLEITFSGIRSDRGQIAAGINKSPEGWPRKPDMDPNWKKSNIRDGKLTVQLKGLAYGTYAVSVLDDENSNLEMDMFLGIPKEGFGFSQNPGMGLSAPRFDECSFTIDAPLKKINIELRYTGKDG